LVPVAVLLTVPEYWAVTALVGGGIMPVLVAGLCFLGANRVKEP
jgi:hypothetical protein